MRTALQIVAVLALMACGYVARRRGLLSETGTREFSRVLVAFIYPALIIASLPRLTLPQLLRNSAMPLMAMVIVGVGLLLGLLALRFLGEMSRTTAGSFLFHCVFGNYLFLPLPLVLFMWGPQGVALLLFSSFVFEVVMWTLGVFLLTGALSRRQRLRSLLNPAFCTLVGTLLYVVVRDLWAGRWGYDRLLAGGFGELRHVIAFGAEALGQGTIPVSMLIAGSRMATLHPRAMLRGQVWMVSALRLLVVPAIVLPLIQVVPMEPTARGVLTIVGVMPCAVASVFFSERFGGDSELIAGALLLTHLWAVITVPLFLAWWL